MDCIKFDVPGECRGKMRPKASSIAGHASIYTPAKQVEYENWVRQCYMDQRETDEPFAREVPLHVVIEVFMAVPKSFSKKKREQALRHYIRPTKKPDLDNCAKSILDALNGIAYADDSQVVYLSVSKKYAESAHTVVWIKEDMSWA